MILLGLCMMAWAYFIGGPAWQRARAWPTAEGVVVVSEIREVMGDIAPVIVIEYKVGDRAFRTDAETFTSLCTLSRVLKILDYLGSKTPRRDRLSYANGKLSDYPLGGRTSVYYDPTCPSSAFRRQGHSDFFWVTAMLGFMIALFGLILQESALRPRLGGFFTQMMIPTYTFFTGCGTLVLALLAVFMVSVMGDEGLAGIVKMVVFGLGSFLLGWLTVQGFRNAYDKWASGG